MHRKGNCSQNKKTACWMGENTCKWNNLQGVNNIQNTQIAHTTQYIKKKQPN